MSDREASRLQVVEEANAKRRWCIVGVRRASPSTPNRGRECPRCETSTTVGESCSENSACTGSARHKCSGVTAVCVCGVAPLSGRRPKRAIDGGPALPQPLRPPWNARARVVNRIRTRRTSGPDGITMAAERPCSVPVQTE